jgi:hypothetical protein
MKGNHVSAQSPASVLPLREFINAQPVGEIAGTRKLIELLSACWEEFIGNDQTSMRDDKLWRMENPTWQPPFIEFKLERHGPTAMGSSRAAVCKWRLDMEELTACVCDAGHRQIRLMDARLDVNALAKSVGAAIISGVDDDRIKRLPDGCVQLVIGTLVPETNQQTTTERRKRLRKALDTFLEPHGWRSRRPNVYCQGC